jgi:hypothetical protein
MTTYPSAPMPKSHQKKSHTPRKRDKKRRSGLTSGGGELQGTHGTMTGMVRGFRRVTGASSSEKRSTTGTVLLIVLAAGLAFLLAYGLTN